MVVSIQTKLHSQSLDDFFFGKYWVYRRNNNPNFFKHILQNWRSYGIILGHLGNDVGLFESQGMQPSGTQIWKLSKNVAFLFKVALISYNQALSLRFNQARQNSRFKLW